MHRVDWDTVWHSVGVVLLLGGLVVAALLLMTIAWAALITLVRAVMEWHLDRSER